MLKFDFLSEHNEEIMDIEIEELAVKDIAIIGLSLNMPGADSTDRFWELLARGEDGVGPFPQNRRTDLQAYLKRIGEDDTAIRYYEGAYLSEVDRFDYRLFKLSPKEASLMSPNQRLFLQTAWSAIEDAGYGGGRLSGSQTGVYVGYNNDTFHDYKRLVAELEPESLSLAVPGNLSSIIAGRLSYMLNLKGPAITVDTACSSSLVALHLACQALRNGECEMAVAGGVKTYVLPIDQGIRIGIESSDGRARTFDDSSDGTGGGEGVVTVLLKPLERALHDGDHIYAVIKGSAMNQDGASVGLTAPNVQAQEEVIVRAWQDAGIDPATISYIEAHGTGTKLGDPIEIEGISRAFRRYTDRVQFCAIGSIKTNIGHLDHAAGLAGLAKAVLSLERKQIPPSIHFHKPNSKISFIDSPVYVNDRLREWDGQRSPRRCGVSAFGMSGTNCHIVLEEAPSFLRESESTDEPQILCLSAKTKESLSALIHKYDVFIKSGASFRLRDLCFTANMGRGHYTHRIAIVIRNREDLRQALGELQRVDLHNMKGPMVFYGECLDDGHAMQDLPGRDEPEQWCRFYVEGADLPWDHWFSDSDLCRIPIPTYAFDGHRCWVEDNGRPHRYHDYMLREMQESYGTVAATKVTNVTIRDAADASEMEKLVAQVWGEVLGFRELGLDENYYELGGDSILALKIANQLSERMNGKVEVSELLRHMTVRELAQHVQQKFAGQPLAAAWSDSSAADDCSSAASAADTESVTRGADEQGGQVCLYPVSAAQRRIYLVHHSDTTGIAYNMPIVLQLEGALDTQRLEDVLQVLVSRHEALRTSFDLQDGELVQQVWPACELLLERHNVETEDELDEITRRFVRPFRLHEAPLFRASLVRTGVDKHVLLLDMHHIVSDGSSLAVLIREFSAIYAGSRLPEVTVQYRDFVTWQAERKHSAEAEAHAQFWLNRFTELPAALSMPLDHPRGAMRRNEGATFDFHIDAELAERMRQYAKQHRVTLNSLMMAIYFTMLHKYAGQSDLTVGSIVTGRPKAEFEQVVGVCINFVPIRLQVNEAESFIGFARRLHEEQIAVYDHQDYPFDELVERLGLQPDRARNPLYDTMFIFHNEFTFGGEAASKELTIREKPLRTDIAVLDFKFDVFRSRDDGLHIALQFNTSLYMEQTMQQLAMDYVALAEMVVDEPQRLIGDIRLFSPDEELGLAAKREQSEAKAQHAVRVVMSATFTVDPLKPYVEWWSNKFGLPSKAVIAPYHQVVQELLDPQSATSLNDGINMLFIRFEDWLRHDEGSVEQQKQKLNELYTQLCSILRQKSKQVPYWVFVFPVSPTLPTAIAEHISFLNKRWLEDLRVMDNVHVMKVDDLAERYRISEVYDEVKDQAGHMPFTDEYYAALGTDIGRKLIAWRRQHFKLIVLDCDNTLWKGVVGEDGPLGVTVEGSYRALQRRMLDCMNQGMMLALCSKNNEADVWEVFDRHPHMLLKKEHFVAWRINWQDKPGNVRDMAQQLNIGADSFIFIDDSPVECGQMIDRCPEVLTLKLPEEDAIPSFLEHIWALDRFTVTDEDAKRTAMYQAEHQRQEGKSQFADITEYWRSLQLRMSLRVPQPEEYVRAAQLTQRTNQFNSSTVRRTVEEMEQLSAKADALLWIAEVADKFGEYGITGLVEAAVIEDRLRIEALLLSCRVLGRGIEDAVITQLMRYAQERGLQSVEVVFVQTEKNQPFLEFVQRTGWIPSTSTDGKQIFTLSVDKGDAFQHCVECVMHRSLQPVTVSVNGGQQEAAAVAIPADHEDEYLETIVMKENAFISPILSNSLVLNWDAYTADGLHHAHHYVPLSYATGVALLQIPLGAVEEHSHASAPYAEAETETERRLMQLWTEVLRVERISRYDSFFDIGGNSLKATSLSSKVHKTFGVDLSILQIMDTPILRELAVAIDSMNVTVDYRPIPRIPEHPYYAASGAQSKLYFLSQWNPESTAYNIPSALIVEGTFDLRRLEEAFRQLIARHEPLRTSFTLQDGEVVQVIHDEVPFETEHLGAVREEELTVVIDAWMRPYVLQQAPIFRVAIGELGAQRSILILDMHHIISDGISMGILLQELFILYEGRSLPPLLIRYRDFAEWQKQKLVSGEWMEHKQYWLNQFAGEPPVLRLPTDFPRTEEMIAVGERLDFEINAELSELVRKLAQQEGCTLHMALLASYYILLGKYANQEDVTVGSLQAGRTHPDTESLIGMFVNTLALRCQPEGHKSFRRFLQEVKTCTLEAYRHQEYPFEELVNALQLRENGRNPLFDTLFVLQNQEIELPALRDFQVQLFDTGHRFARFELTVQAWDRPEGIALTVNYFTSVFRASTVEMMMRDYMDLIAQVVQNPEIALRDLRFESTHVTVESVMNNDLDFEW